jgi:hypothetical protein
VALMAFAGCGGSGTDTRADSSATPTKITRVPLGPSTSNPRVVIRDARDSGRFERQGRTWQGCGVTAVHTVSFYDYRYVAVSGPWDCPAATRVIVALAEQVGSASGDCFPGYCTADEPRPITVAGHRCTATPDPDSDSIHLFVVCARGDTAVSVTVADDE